MVTFQRTCRPPQPLVWTPAEILLCGGQGFVAEVSGDGAQILAAVHEAVGAHVPDGVKGELADVGPAADTMDQAAPLGVGPVRLGVDKNVFRVAAGAAGELVEDVLQFRRHGQPIFLHLTAFPFSGPQADLLPVPVQVRPFQPHDLPYPAQGIKYREKKRPSVAGRQQEPPPFLFGDVHQVPGVGRQPVDLQAGVDEHESLGDSPGKQGAEVFAVVIVVVIGGPGEKILADQVGGDV